MTDPALQSLGLIVRGADVKGQEQISSESAGLRAIAHGFAISGASDEELLRRNFPFMTHCSSICGGEWVE